MKRTLALFLSLAMLFLLTACNKGKADKYCSQCGQGLDSNVAFCGSCGFEVGVKEKETTAITETTTQVLTTTTQDESVDVTTNTEKTEDKKEKNTTTKATTTTRTTTTKIATTTKATTATTKTTTTNATTTNATTTKTTTTTQSQHKHNYIETVVPPTCTEGGFTKYTCTCGDEYIRDYKQATHTYSKYVCTQCGEIDKIHAYEYLIEWVKENGEVNGSHVSVYIINDFNAMMGITYTAQNDRLYVSWLEVEENRNCYTSVYLDDYFYGYSYKYTSWDNTIYGYLNAEEFTNRSPIAYEEYQGDESFLYDMQQLSRLAVCVVLEELQMYLSENNVGISLSDIGFKSF